MVTPAALESIATPALLLEVGVLRTNIEGMATRARALGVDLRPHAKTHKSPAVATLQHEHGAQGLTVGTLEEAERLCASGFDDLLLTVPPVGRWRNDRIVRLGREVRLRVALDSAEAAFELESACRRSHAHIGFLWEVDCGVGRFGTSPGAESANAIVDVLRSVRHATFDGLLAFGGHAYSAPDDKGVTAAAKDERDAVLETVELLSERGIEVPLRSIGTTPTSYRMGNGDGITEIRPGNYVFHDATQVAMGMVEPKRCAVSVAATVVSRPAADRLILDAGSKALGADRLSPRTTGFGLVPGHPELLVQRLYEEQAIVVVRGACDLRVGDRVQVIPNHSCTTVNLHSEYLVVEDDSIVDVWPVAARGWQPSHAGAARQIAETV